MIFGLATEHYADLASIFSRYAVDSVLIYGSRATGAHRPDSDFDLAVQASDLSDQQFSQLWAELMELPLIFKLDIVHWNTLASTTLKEKIASEGRPFWPLDQNRHQA